MTEAAVLFNRRGKEMLDILQCREQLSCLLHNFYMLRGHVCRSKMKNMQNYLSNLYIQNLFVYSDNTQWLFQKYSWCINNEDFVSIASEINQELFIFLTSHITEYKLVVVSEPPGQDAWVIATVYKEIQLYRHVSFLCLLTKPCQLHTKWNT